MKIPFFALAVAFVSLIAFLNGPGLQAQTSSAGEKIELEKFGAHLGELEQRMEEKLAVMRAEVEAQAAAKQISEVLASSLRWNVRATAFNTYGFNPRDIVSTLRIPPENPKLVAAATALEDTVNQIQKERARLVLDGAPEIRRRYEETLAAAKTAEAALAVRHVIEQARLPSDFTDPRIAEYAAAAREASAGLEALASLLRAIEGGQMESIRAAVPLFRSAVAGQFGRQPSIAGQMRLQRLLEPFQEAANAAEEPLAAAIAAGRPEPEIEAAIDTLAKAESIAWELAEPSRTGLLRANIYRLLVSIWMAAKSDDPVRLRDALGQAKSALASIPETKRGKLRPMVETAERQAADMAIRARDERAEAVRARILAAKGPDELAKVSAEVTVAARKAEPAGSDNLSGLTNELNLLAAWWAGAELTGSEGGRSSYNGQFARELGVLRAQIDREVTSRRLRLPELNTPPLAKLPLAEAMDSVCDDLAARSEWRRLYEVLTMRPASPRNHTATEGRDDTVAALRSFFAGENFELAESWSAAAQSYLTVLQCVSPRAPVKAAALRLKTIQREHPEAVPASGTAVRPRPPGF